MRLGTGVACLAAASIIACAAASAETVEEFYKGKTLNLYIGTGESSGAVGAYPRNLSEVVGRYIPGNPQVIVRNMPGAGGIKLANYVYGIAPQDGTSWAFITRGFLLAPLLNLSGVQFDPSELAWIGSPARTDSVGAVWSTSTDVKTIEDAMKTQVVVGATTLGQGTGAFPTMLNQLIGTKFKVVSGYKSVGDVELAMEKGELQGKIDWTWGSLMSGRTAEWVKDGKVRVIIQLGLKKSPKIPAEVPLALDLAGNDEDRQVMEVLCSPSATGYPSFMGPGVPEDRVQAVRAAFRKSMTDPRFIALAEKQRLELDPIDGEEITQVVKNLYSKSPHVVERMRELMPKSD